MQDRQPRPYQPDPHYPAAGNTIITGWDALGTEVPLTPTVLAIDGPCLVDWSGVMEHLTRALDARGLRSSRTDLRAFLAPWPKIVARTSSAALADDPDFERLADGSLADLFDSLPHCERPTEGVHLVFGPGAALVPHDLLWYADLPKRYAEAAVVSGHGRNLGQREQDGPGTTKRLFYIDWPLLDRHRDTLVGQVDRWLDCQNPLRPASLDGPTLRRTLTQLARRPFRTRPTFNTTSWGGHWAQRELGMNRQAPNTALGYELIAPESGVLIGSQDARVEVPFQLVVARHPEELLGPWAHARFGTSFPIRFDYLDTVDGGNLSVHCHPQSAYMREVFGWPYTQHETYYLMVGGPDHTVYLGLHEGANLEAFQRQAHEARYDGRPFDITRYVQTFPAEPHQLFVIPAGTPHGSGAGNVVLEVSATPYLYSLRFYDWLRRDGEGAQRPVHLGHAFANLATDRTGTRVPDELVPVPRTLRRGPGWREELLGALPEMFFEVRRVAVAVGESAEDDTVDRFHVVTVVEGQGVLLETTDGCRHSMAYAETLVIPAAVGAYTLHALGTEPVRLVKALVR